MVNIRDYEVSIWTLQDSFIAILKQSNLENMEKIQEPKMVLKDDGENSFSFKIPMYLKKDTDLSTKPYFKDESTFVENPIWYTVRNGNLISSLRKIKVIFNKNSSDEEIFEFIINNIKESHEGKSKFCEVECGGLAFHELGKQGYDIVLSADEYNADYQKWFESDRSEPEPINNIEYWIKKVLANSNWDYVINMDWSLYDGIINGDRSGNVRQANKVYRKPYISSWVIDEDDNKLIAAESVTDFNELEKRETVEGSESNRYNLLQTIAEAFQVFCKFKYLYDDNYHIIGRQVVFYNNFIKEAEGIIDFNYGYNTSQIVREMDGTDLVTKMYVKPLNNSGTFAGEISLRDTKANPSLENYLLNFNYLYAIGTISQEQYDEINSFQKELRKLNLEYEEETLKLRDYTNKIPIEEALLQTSEDTIKQANERIEEASTAIGALVEDDGLISFPTTNPRHFTVIHDTNSSKSYININREYQSFVPSSFSLYKSIDAKGAVSGNNITGIKFKKDSNGLITSVIFPSSQLSNDNTSVYAVFQYNPYTPNKIIKNIWKSKLKQAEKDKADATRVLGSIDEPVKAGLYLSKKNCEDRIEEILIDKQNLINRFERIMGPALREGTWQPEDEYVNYRKNSVFSLEGNSLVSIDNITDGVAHFSWESSWGSRMEEQTLDYAYGANETRYYPCIDLRNVSLSSLTEEEIENLNLVYRDPYLSAYTNNYPEGDPRVNHYLQIGSDNGCKIMFIKKKNSAEIIPVLIVLGVNLLMDTIVGSSIKKPAEQIKASARLSVISYSEENISEVKKVVESLTWITDTQNYEIVYPKFSISIDRYISTTPENKIYYNNKPLKEYEDYSAPIFHENKYWLMIKPEVAFFKPIGEKYQFYYSITTTPEAIYLDAIEILRENSVPKVSYTISPLAIDQNLIKNAYNRLGQLAHINDQELKFENVQGYISEVNLDLDKPWEDNYTIKNYKTKFEDLFSSIVAQTEAMKKNSQLFNMVSNAFNSNGLLNDGLLDDIKDRLNFYVPTPAEIYSQYEPQIRAELQQAFNEAGEVLIAAQNSVNDVNDLNIANSRILGGFVENIKKNLTPSTFKGSPRSSEVFKTGDIWQIGDNEYLAVENSSQVQYSSGENRLTSLKGWVLTQDGRLAEITGAAIDVDAKAGNISLKAANKIEVLAKTQLDLASEDIFITGNNSVNIGSKWVNIAGTNGGINIVTSNIDTSTTKNSDGTASGTSALKLNKDGILIASNAEVTIKSAKGIKIYSSDTAETSALTINRTDGIFIGSTLPIVFYSGGTNKTMNGAASAKITSDRILFGVSNGQTGTAVDLTKDYIIFGASFINSNGVPSTTDVGSKNGTAGIKIARDSIQLATGTAEKDSDNNYTYNNRNYIAMNKNGITIANADNENNGAIIKINGSGVLIGVASKKSTFTTPISAGQAFSGEYDGARFQVYAPNFVVDANGHLYAYDADIAGRIRATSLIITQNNTSQNIENYIKAFGYMKTTDANNTFLNNADFEVDGDLGLIRGAAYKTTKSGRLISGAQLVLDSNGYLQFASISGTGNLATITLNNGYITLSSVGGTSSINSSSNVKIGPNKISINTSGSFDVTSNNFYVNSGVTSGVNFRLGKSSSPDLSYTIGEGLTVKGAITATSFILGPSASIPQDKVSGLTDELNNVKAIEGTVTYQAHSSGTSTPTGTWSTTVPALTDSKPYLWTRTVITYGTSGKTSTSYSISYKGSDGKDGANGANGANGKDGTNGIYVTEITSLYWLSSTTLTNSNKPKSKVTSDEDSAGGWRIIVPTYRTNYTYYRCEQYKWSDSDNHFSWSDVYKDGGLTIANKTATSASTTASNTRDALEIMVPGTFKNGLYQDYTLAGKTYSVALTGTKGLFIGGGSYVTIASQNSTSAVVTLDKSGIALNGSEINLTATNGNTTSTISLNGNGINLGATGKLVINTNNFTITEAGSVEIKGRVTANSGEIAGWKILSDGLYSPAYDPEKDDISTFCRSVLKVVGNNFFLLGAPMKTTSAGVVTTDWENAPFRISKEGAVTATKGTIGGWTINNSSIYSGTQSKGGMFLNYTSTGGTISLYQDNFRMVYINSVEEKKSGYVFRVGDMANSIPSDKSDSSGICYYYRNEQDDGKHGWTEIWGTVMLNGHRLYFHNTKVPTKYATEEDIYLFRKSSEGSPGSSWQEVKVYRLAV